MEHFAFPNQSLENYLGNETEANGSNPDPVLYCTLIAVLTAFGLTGNCLILVLFSTNRFCRTSYSVYVRTLAVSDSLALITTLTDDVLTRLVDPDILHKTREICFVKLTWTSFIFVLSSALVLAISVDRYIAVCKPNRRATFCTFRRAIWVTSSVIITCFVLSLPASIWNEIDTKHFFDSKDSKEEDYECPIGKAYVLYESISDFILILFAPFCLVMILNLRSAAVIRSSLKRQGDMCDERLNFMIQVRVTLSFIAVTISSVLVLFPVIVVGVVEMIIQLNGNDDPHVQATIDQAWSICNVIRLINYAQNFYVFLIFGKEYRSKLRKLLGISRVNMYRANTYQSVVESSGPSATSRI